MFRVDIGEDIRGGGEIGRSCHFEVLCSVFKIQATTVCTGNITLLQSRWNVLYIFWGGEEGGKAD